MQSPLLETIPLRPRYSNAQKAVIILGLLLLVPTLMVLPWFLRPLAQRDVDRAEAVPLNLTTTQLMDECRPSLIYPTELPYPFCSWVFIGQTDGWMEYGYQDWRQRMIDINKVVYFLAYSTIVFLNIVTVCGFGTLIWDWSKRMKKDNPESLLSVPSALEGETETATTEQQHV